MWLADSTTRCTAYSYHLIVDDSTDNIEGLGLIFEPVQTDNLTIEGIIFVDLLEFWNLLHSDVREYAINGRHIYYIKPAY